MMETFGLQPIRNAGLNIRRCAARAHPAVRAGMCTRSMPRALGACLTLLLLAAGSVRGVDAPQQVHVRIAERKVLEPADGRLVLRRGDTVRIHWLCDEAVQLHVHGYDLLVTLQAGQPQITPFTAHASRRYPVTSHGFGADGAHGRHGRALLYIEVQPR
jgi:hypothetical protein